MYKASKWFDKNPAAQARFEDLEDWIEELEERIKKDEGQIVFFAMSVPDYELMAYNTQELKRFITELQQVIVYYKEVTTVAD